MSRSSHVDEPQECILTNLLQWELLPPTLSLAQIKKLVLLVHISHKEYSWYRPKHIIQETCNIVHSLLKLSQYAPFSEALRAEVREVHDSVLNTLETYPLVLHVWEGTGSPIAALRSFLLSSQSCIQLAKLLDAEGESVAGKFFFCYYARLIFAPEEDVLARAFALVVKIQRLHAPSLKRADTLLLTLCFNAMRLFSAVRDAAEFSEKTAPDAALSPPLHIAFPDIDALCKEAAAVQVPPFGIEGNEGTAISSSISNHLLHALVNMVSGYSERQGQTWIFLDKEYLLQLVEKLVGTLEWQEDEDGLADYLPPPVIQRLRKEMLKHLIWNQRKALLSESGLQNVKNLIRTEKYSQVRLLVQAFPRDSEEYMKISACCVEVLQQKRDKCFSAAQSALKDELSGKVAHPEAKVTSTGVHGGEGCGRGRRMCVDADSHQIQHIPKNELNPKKKRRRAEGVDGETELKGVRCTGGTEQAGMGGVTAMPQSSEVGAGPGEAGNAGATKKRRRRRLKPRLSCKCFHSALPLVYLDCFTETCCAAMVVAREVLGSEQDGMDENLRSFLKETWEQRFYDQEGSELLCCALDCLLRDDARHRSQLSEWVNKEAKWLQRIFYNELPLEFARYRLKHMTGTGKVEGCGAVARCCLGRSGKLLLVSNPSKDTTVGASPWAPTPGPMPHAWEGWKKRGVAVGNSREEFCLLEARFWEKWETASKVEEMMMSLESMAEAVASNDAVQHTYRDMFFKRLLLFPHLLPSSPLEARMLEALLPLIGAQAVTDMEGAMGDVQSVRHNDNLYHLSQARQPTLVSDDCRLSVTTHCEGLWPLPPAPPLKSLQLPPPMAGCVEKYEAFYAGETKNRHLRWQHTLGRCQLSMRLPQGQQLVVLATTLQAAVLLHFENPQDALSFEEMRRRLNIDPHHLRPLLHSLACCKRPLLKKSPKEHGPVGTSDSFQVHSGNRPYLRRRKVEMPPPIKPQEYERRWPGPLTATKEGIGGPSQTASGRKDTREGEGGRRWGGVMEGQSMKFAVDAAIVAILKKKKRLTVHVLVQEVVGKLVEWGYVSEEFVTTRIEALEGRDFAKREEGDPPAISYIP